MHAMGASPVAVEEFPNRGRLDLSVVAPCYNEIASIDEFCRRADAACRSLACPYEIVIVDDGSTDGNWERLQELTTRYDSVVAVKLSRNHGHQLALAAGLSTCRGARILIIDADLQDPPELLGHMWEIMDEGVDVVFGQRRTRKAETRFKLGSAYLFNRLIDVLSDVRIPRDVGDFRLISRRALDVILRMQERHRFTRGLISWIGFPQRPISYDRDERYAGETKYTLGKMLRLAIDAITSMSTKPLAVATYVGFAASVVAFCILGYSFTAWLWGRTVPGWASLLVTLSFLFGLQFLILGVMGEYLGRVYEQVKGRPLFVIEDVVRPSETVSAGRSDIRLSSAPARIDPHLGQPRCASSGRSGTPS